MLLCAPPSVAAPASVQMPTWLGIRASDGVDRAQLRQHLELRLPQVEIGFANVPVEQASSLHAYVLLTQRDGGFDLTLVLSDGRAYDRRMDAGAGSPERVLANDIASLLRAASSGQTAADREGVTIDDGQAPTSDDAATTANEDPTDPPNAETPPPSTTPAPGPELAIHAAGLFSLALASDPLPTSLALGAQLGTDLAFTRGGLLTLWFRPTFHAAGLPVSRWGVGLGGGYRLRRERFEMTTSLAARFEPVVVADLDGLRREGQSIQRLPPLWGAHLSAAPGVRVGRAKRLRVGARVDLSYLVAARDGVGTPKIYEVHDDGTRELAARVGGGELALGLDLAYWFSLRPRTQTRPAGPQ